VGKPTSIKEILRRKRNLKDWWVELCGTGCCSHCVPENKAENPLVVLNEAKNGGDQQGLLEWSPQLSYTSIYHSFL
jgi:hypothetical protein